MQVAPRYPLDFPITVLTSDKVVWGISRNLSYTGLGLWLPNTGSLELGQIVNLVVRIGEPSGELRAVSLKIQVIWKKDEHCGVHILEMAPDDRSFYETMIEGYASLIDAEPFWWEDKENGRKAA